MRNLLHKTSSQKLRKARELEREVLQHESSQKSFSNGGRIAAQEISESINHETLEEIKMRKSMSFLNPAKIEKLCPNCLYQYSCLSDKQLNLLLRPRILKADKSIFLELVYYTKAACNIIARRISNEEKARNLQKAWQDKNREILRVKLKQKHDTNTEMQNSLGITKSTFNKTLYKASQRINELSTTHKPKSSSFLGSDFNGLILPNYTLNQTRKYAFNSPTTELRQSFTKTGFPYPEFSGIVCNASNQPLSRTISFIEPCGNSTIIDKSKTFHRCEDEAIIAKRKELEEKRKKQEEIQKIQDVRVFFLTFKNHKGLENDDREA